MPKLPNKGYSVAIEDKVTSFSTLVGMSRFFDGYDGDTISVGQKWN